MDKHQTFLKARQTGIGGSDVAAILGYSKYKTALDVFLSKTTEQPELQSEHLYWGHALEAPISERFSQETGYKIFRQPEIKRHPKHNWAIANADGLILDPQTQNPIGILEIKTSNAFKTSDWSQDENDPDGIPIEYLAQVQWYLEIFDLDLAYLAVLIGGNNYRHYRIERDREVAENLIEQCGKFWHNNVLTNTPPKPQTANDLIKLYPEEDGQSIEADTETLISFNKLRELKAQEKTLTEEIKTQETFLKAKIGAHSTMQMGGEKLFTWKNQNRTIFDKESFQAVHPDLYQQFCKTSNTRILRLSKI